MPIGQKKVLFVREIIDSLQILVPLFDILFALGFKSDLDEVIRFMEDKV